MTIHSTSALLVLAFAAGCSNPDVSLGDSAAKATGAGGASALPSVTGGAAGEAGSGSVVTPEADGSTATPGACNQLPDPTRGVNITFRNQIPLASTGGPIEDGVYELVSASVFTDLAAISIEGRAERLEIAGGTWNHASYWDSAPTAHYTDEMTKSGTSLSLRRTCGTAKDSGVLLGTTAEYSATASSLTLNFPYYEQGESRGAALLVYGKVDSPTPDAGPSCAEVGCALPPLCGEACSSPCGCCSCAPGDYTAVGGNALQCEAGCFAKAEYTVLDMATNQFRLGVSRKSTGANTCDRVVVAYGSSSPYHVVTRPSWSVETIWHSNDATDCDAVGQGAPNGALVAVEATGDVSINPDVSGCLVDLNVTALFPDGSSTVKRTLMAQHLPASLCP